MFDYFCKPHEINQSARQFLRYIGPGILISVGFIDPGNWATNVVAGADFGYVLLWVITLSTIVLIFLQHNAAHLGIVTGLCLSEAARAHLKSWISLPVLLSAMIAAVATAMAEILGSAIALNLLCAIPLKFAAILTTFLCAWLLWSNSYKKLEKLIIGFVSLIGLSFLYELTLVQIDWGQAAVAWIAPVIPDGSIAIIMGVLGATVMPGNLFLHSEVIQSRQWHIENEELIRKQLKYEFFDTLLSMGVGWAINSAMILIAASVFLTHQIQVTELQQAQEMLKPVLGTMAAVVFAVALLFSGVASKLTTAGMAGGSIAAGMFQESYDIRDWHSQMGGNHYLWSGSGDYIVSAGCPAGNGLFSNSAQYAIAVHDLFADLFNFVCESNGAVCELYDAKKHFIFDWVYYDGLKYFIVRKNFFLENSVMC